MHHNAYQPGAASLLGKIGPAALISLYMLLREEQRPFLLHVAVFSESMICQTLTTGTRPDLRIQVVGALVFKKTDVKGQKSCFLCVYSYKAFFMVSNFFGGTPFC